jgi:SH3-like domain-containing protein
MRPATVAMMLAGAAAIPAGAADFRSVAEPAAIVYDAPSLKGRKLYVLGRGYPVEIIVVVEGWVKVRDAGGELSWIESRMLGNNRTVMIRVPLAQVHESADEQSRVVFQAQQNVLLDLLEPAPAGWLRVRHREGQSGFVRVAQVWGA